MRPWHRGRGASAPHASRHRPEPAAACGFTLIELAVLAAILGAIVAASAPVYGGYRDRARNARAEADITSIQFDLRFYATANNGALPNRLEELGRGTIRDPWGNPYQYLNMATVHGHESVRKDRFLVPLNTDYDLYSMGKDGQSRLPLTARVSRDDIIRAGNGAFIGLASDF